MLSPELKTILENIHALDMNLIFCAENRFFSQIPRAVEKRGECLADLFSWFKNKTLYTADLNEWASVYAKMKERDLRIRQLLRVLYDESKEDFFKVKSKATLSPYGSHKRSQERIRI